MTGCSRKKFVPGSILIVSLTLHTETVTPWPQKFRCLRGHTDGRRSQLSRVLFGISGNGYRNSISELSGRIREAAVTRTILLNNNVFRLSETCKFSAAKGSRRERKKNRITVVRYTSARRTGRRPSADRTEST